MQDQQTTSADTLIELCLERGANWKLEDLVRFLDGNESLAKEVWAKVEGIRKLDGRMKKAIEPVANCPSTHELKQRRSDFGNIDIKASLVKKSCVNQGGMGIVWVYQDSFFAREVAIKFLNSDQLSEREANERLRNEAEITAKLDHPGVPPVFAYGQAADGTPCFVMRYIRGRPFSELIGALRRPKDRYEEVNREELFRDVLKQFSAVSAIMAYAHERGVVHRDLKPDNIRVDRHGDVVVLDWGCAALFDPKSDSSKVNYSAILLADSVERKELTGGTPAYVSPERWQGGPPKPSNDIYSLGVILYEILTGELPIESDVAHAEIASRASTAKYVDVAKACRDLDGIPNLSELFAITRRSMAVRPEDRYARASELSEDVENVLADRPISFYRSPVSTTIVRTIRKHKRVSFALAGLVITVLAVSAVLSTLLSVENGKRRQEIAIRLEQERIANQDRDLVLRTMASFAADQVAAELAARFLFLNDIATDGKVIDLYREATSGNRDSSQQLQEILTAYFKDKSDSTRPESIWFQDIKGVQLARLPVSKTIGQKFDYRQYFHGLERDFEEGNGQPMQQRPNLSIVYASASEKKNYRIALNYPIKLGDQYVGLVGMSVELDRLASLNTGRDLKGITIALADWRSYPIGHLERAGAIIHRVGQVPPLEVSSEGSVRFVPTELLGLEMQDGEVWVGSTPNIEMEILERRTAIAKVRWRPFDHEREALRFRLPTLMVVVQR